MKYNHLEIEPKWQKYWEENKLFQSIRHPDKPKKYILDMFPYPSAEGLHVGHPEGYTATDILSRYYRMKGFDVLHPMGWDAFGLPAEQFAIKTNIHPANTTIANISNFKKQLKSLGFSYDWSKEINTTDPNYVKWTQWFFIQMFNNGLAYQSEAPVNWCEKLGTVLSDEEVIDGLSERGQHPVTKLPLRQWMLKITSYADQLLEGLDKLDWPEGTKTMQRNWIGKTDSCLNLKNWIFSRQRYWGEPIPIYFPIELHDNNTDPRKNDNYTIRYDLPIAVDESELPLLLPEIDYYASDNPSGALFRAKHWRFFQKDNKWFARETSTMPQWAGSCWYYLRYIDPNNNLSFASEKSQEDWLPVDIYVGGAEHATLHLLYARFWHQVLFNLKFISTPEPFIKLFHQGMILGEDGVKMSKSRGNVVNPDDIINQYGADVLRLYLMFMGPLDAVKPWQHKQIQGMVRLHNRICNIFDQKLCNNISDTTLKILNQTIKKVSEDIELLSFNTAISSLMRLLKHLEELKEIPLKVIEDLILLLSPFTPHLSEELWWLLGYRYSTLNAEWPKYNEYLIDEDAVEIVLQINGKIKGKIVVAYNSEQETVINVFKNTTEYNKYFKDIKKIIFKQNKILSLVI